jgi:aspartyl-tRNA(Asn)/glutamyl-tRNA(Gln) amidotransferase subunit A
MSAADELAFLTASDLVRLYRRRDVSPVEVTEAVLARIERCNGHYNAFCLVAGESALGEAKASESRWRAGRPRSYLDGVPATIKDIILTKGWPTLRGSLTIDPAQPWEEDAPVVMRLREAGAVILGKTTTPEFGWKGVCDSPRHGVTRNPWNDRLTPGGSSGGAAVAAALGLGCLHVGTDGGGSIRIPAGFTGIFGIKPTFGLVPAYPLSPFGTIAHLGPMTASVEDAARMLTIISQPDDRDWYSLPYLPRDFTVGLEAGARGLRAALSTTLGYAEVDPEIVSLVDAAADMLRELGAEVELRDPGFSDPLETFAAHWFTGAAAVYASILPEHWPLLDPGFVGFAEAGARIPHMDYVAAVNRRAEIGYHMAQFHRDFDVLLTPTLPLAAFEAGHVAPPSTGQTNWMHWAPFSFPFNLTQQPAASIPCGFTSSGLPVGLQIVAAKHRDDLVLRVARAFESVHPIKRPVVDCGPAARATSPARSVQVQSSPQPNLEQVDSTWPSH